MGWFRKTNVTLLASCFLLHSMELYGNPRECAPFRLIYQSLESVILSCALQCKRVPHHSSNANLHKDSTDA